MPRRAREIIESETYHIMMRGVNKQKIFNSDADYRKMYKSICKYQEELGAEIYAWCLMPNHLHLLVKSQNIGLLVQKIGCSYVAYYNKKNSRVGHLFQDRFKSVPVKDEAYLITLIRYIHQNPVKAGLGTIGEYKWSSYNEYIRRAQEKNCEIYDELFGTKENYVRYMNELDMDYVDEIDLEKATDIEARELISKYFGEHRSLDDMSRIERDDVLKQLLKLGVQPIQLVKYLGLSKYYAYKLKSGK